MSYSTILFHGPTAKSRALSEGSRIGRLAADPFGLEGLKVDEARSLVALLHQGVLDESSGNRGFVLVGPMDHCASKSSDALLKALEEPPGDIHPILWAEDIGEVSPTIRSRCLQQWCPGDEPPIEDGVEEAARNILFAYEQKDWCLLPEPQQVKGLEVLRTLCGLLDPVKHGVLWEHLRPILSHTNPSPLEVLSAVVNAGSTL